MEEQIKNTRDKLIQEWFRKLLSGEINNDILLLEECNQVYYNNILNIFKNHNIDKAKYTIINKNNRNNININNDTNIIYCFSFDEPKISLLYLDILNTKSFLYIPTGHTFYNNISKYLSNDLPNYSNLTLDKRYLYYIEKIDTFDFIEKNIGTQVDDFIKFIIYDGCLSWDNELQNVLVYNYKHLKYDLSLLANAKILTSRLAIFLYKITKLDIKTSNTTIGRYFHTKIGTKSKTLNLDMLLRQNRINKSFFTTKVSIDYIKRNFKAYDLKVDESALKIRKEIAINLITAFLDNKTLDIDNIGKMTNLPKKEVQILKDKLIQKKALLAMASC